MKDNTRIMILILTFSVLTSCASQQSRNTEVAVNNQTVATEQGEWPQSRPKSEVAKINAQLGMAYLEQKNVQRAKMKLLLALKQSPESPEPWYSMAYFLEATGNIPEARRHYLKAIDIAPKRGDSQNNYGTFLCRAGQYQESIKHFMLAANTPDYIDPAAAYENAGLCAMKMSAYRQAAGYFNQALLKDPARTLSLLKLATVEARLGNKKEAQNYLSQYALVSPPSEESEQLRAQLNASSPTKQADASHQQTVG